MFVGDARPPGGSGGFDKGDKMASSDFEGAMQEARAALDMIVKGDAEAYKALYSDSEEVTLANPFGGIAHGRDEVIETLDRAASNFRDGAYDRLRDDRAARHSRSRIHDGDRALRSQDGRGL